MRLVRITLFLAAFAAAIPAFGQVLDQVISYRSRAYPVGRVLADIQAKYGVKLAVTPQVATEVVLVDVKDVTLNDTLAKIAEVVGGEWQREPDGFRLVRTGANLQNLVNQDRLLLVNRLRAAIQTLIGESGINEPIDLSALMAPRSASRTAPNENQNPMARMAIRLLIGMPAETLAFVEPGQRIVYTSAPTAMQKPLLGNPLFAVRQSMGEMVQVLQLAAKNGVPQTGRSADVRQQAQSLQNQINRLQATPVGKIYLVVRRGRGAGSFSLQCWANDQQGNMLLGTGNINLEVDETVGVAAATPSEVAGTFEAQDQHQVWLKAFKGSGPFEGGVPAATSVSDELRAVLADPLGQEPLAGLPSDVLLAINQSKPTNLVANVPDVSLAVFSQMLASGPRRLSELDTELRSRFMARAESANGWTLIKPIDWNLHLKSRTDRAALKRVIDAVTADQLTIDALADYVRNSPDRGTTNALDQICLRWLFGPSISRQIFSATSSQRDGYVLYGSLSPGQRQAANGNQGLVLQQAQNARDAAHWLVFHSQDGPQMNDNSRITYTGLDRAQAEMLVSSRVQILSEVPMTSQQFRGPGGGGMSERTDVFGQGLPVGTRITMVGGNQNVIRMRNSRTGKTQTIDPGSYGATKASLESGRSRGGMEDVSQYDQFQAARRRQVTIAVMLTPTAMISRTLQDVQATEGGTYGPYNQLPADVRAQIDRAYRSTLDALSKEGQRTEGRGSGRTPPPL